MYVCMYFYIRPAESGCIHAEKSPAKTPTIASQRWLISFKREVAIKIQAHTFTFHSIDLPMENDDAAFYDPFLARDLLTIRATHSKPSCFPHTRILKHSPPVPLSSGYKATEVGPVCQSPGIRPWQS